MSEIDPTVNQAALIAAEVIESELQEGFLREVAAAKVDELPTDALTHEIASIIVPEPTPVAGSGVVLEPRWELVSGAEAAEAVRAATLQNEPRVLSVAQRVGMRLLTDEVRETEAYETIDPDRALFMVEGGANKTSIVRRGVALQGMRHVYGADLAGRELFQFGSGREIPPVRNGAPNKEHEVIRSVTDGLFSEDVTFTEFDANKATAIEDGYELSDIPSLDTAGVSQSEIMVHRQSRRPFLHLVQPRGPRFDEALTSLNVAGRQLVVATNGQYRPKHVLQSALWAQEQGIDNLSVVALGDEPGDVYRYALGNVVTPNRPASAYVNEMVVLWRLANRLLANRTA